MSEIEEACIKAGISTGCYYYRKRVKGLSHDDALSAPKCGWYTEGMTHRKTMSVQNAKKDIENLISLRGTVTRKELFKTLNNYNVQYLKSAISILYEEGRLVAKKSAGTEYRLVSSVDKKGE